MKENRNIEDFFKKRLENTNFSYQESDWVMLEQRLDAAAIPGIGGMVLTPVKLLILGLILIGVTFTAGWFTHAYLNSTENEDESVSGTNQAILFPRERPTPYPAIPEKKETDTKSSQGLTAETIRTDSRSSNDGVSLSAEEKEVSSKGSAEILTDESAAEFADSERMPITTETTIKEWWVARRYPVVDFPVSTREIASHEPLKPTPAAMTGESDEKNRERSFWSRWSVGASLAPDFNSVGISNAKTVTALVGGQLYFDLADRLTVFSGILVNRKKYLAAAEDYSPPSGWSYQGGTPPDEIDGSCKVIDIPLMVSYRWTDFPKVNVSTSAGISNYILLDENYDFLYGGYGYSSNTGSGWSTEENSKLMWGVANVSVSIAFRLNEQFEFRFEPYVKKPLRDVGWGNVDLVSTGTLLTLRYKFYKDRF